MDWVHEPATAISARVLKTLRVGLASAQMAKQQRVKLVTSLSECKIKQATTTSCRECLHMKARAASLCKPALLYRVKHAPQPIQQDGCALWLPRQLLCPRQKKRRYRRVWKSSRKEKSVGLIGVCHSRGLEIINFGFTIL